MMKTHILLTIFIWLLISIFAVSVRAQNTAAAYRFRCSADGEWQNWSAGSYCPAQISTGTGQTTVNIQFEKTENGKKTQSPIYIIYFNYMNAPVATATPGATATPSPDPSTQASAAPTPSPLPDYTVKSVNGENQYCCKDGSCITEKQMKADFNHDCRINSAEHGYIIKEWKP